MKMIRLIPALLLFASCATNNARNNDLEKVEFSAGPCFGACPIFEMKIDGNGNAELDAKRFNDITGNFKGTIKKAQMDSLAMLIKKADLLKLSDKYSARITDMPSYTLSVRFKDGKFKTIADYGPSGPEALKEIYRFITSLRQSQRWK